MKINSDPQKQFPHDGGDSGIEFFFLEETSGKLTRMAGGNAVATEVRDLSMRPKEYWETRPSPAKPHHWTAKEFLDQLLYHKYPPGTLNDRMQIHVLAIRQALVQGEFVPDVVMATEEGRYALADAIMEVKAMDEGAFRLAQQNRASAQFDAVSTFDTIESLVIGGAKLASQARGSMPHSMSIPNYPRQVWCLAKDGCVLVKDTGWHIESLYGTIFQIDLGVAESILRKAALDGRLKYDDLLWFMGADWSPFAVVQECSSTSLGEPGPSM